MVQQRLNAAADAADARARPISASRLAQPRTSNSRQLARIPHAAADCLRDDSAVSRSVVLAASLAPWMMLCPSSFVWSPSTCACRLTNGAVVRCAVRVFALEVSRQSKQWPEKQERVVKWLSAAQAAERVNEPNLGEIIRRMARRYDGRKPGWTARARARTKIK